MWYVIGILVVIVVAFVIGIIVAKNNKDKLAKLNTKIETVVTDIKK